MPQNSIALFGTCRVVIDDDLSLIASHLYQLTVTCYVGYLQVEGHTALLRTLSVTRSSEFEVGFGNTEAIIGLAHNVNTFTRIFSQFHTGDQYAV